VSRKGIIGAQGLARLMFALTIHSAQEPQQSAEAPGRLSQGDDQYLTTIEHNKEIENE